MTQIVYANSHKKRKVCDEENIECYYCKERVLHDSVKQMLKNVMLQSYDAYQSSRKNKVTASKISSVLGENVFKSDTQLVDEWVNGTKFTGNECTVWGETHEPSALKKFTEVTNHRLIPQIDGKTLVVHPKYFYLAASPDGVTYCGKLVEIKCPWSKPVGIRSTTIPSQYKAQVHLQQHVCNMDETFFVTYAPENYKCGKIKAKGRSETINILKFVRDKHWLERNLPKIKLFIMNVAYAKQNKNKSIKEVYMSLLQSE